MTETYYKTVGTPPVKGTLYGLTRIVTRTSMLFVPLLCALIPMFTYLVSGWDNDEVSIEYALVLLMFPIMIYFFGYFWSLVYVKLRVAWRSYTDPTKASAPITIPTLLTNGLAVLVCFPTANIFWNGIEQFENTSFLAFIGQLILVTMVVEMFYYVTIRFFWPLLHSNLVAELSPEEYELYFGEPSPNVKNNTPEPHSLLQHAEPDEPTAQTGQNAFLIIREKAIARDDLILLKSEGNYVNVVTRTQESLVRGPLEDIIEEIGDLEGVRIHRSQWIAFHACSSVERKGKELFVVLKSGEKLKVARSRQKHVQSQFGLSH